MTETVGRYARARVPLSLLPAAVAAAAADDPHEPTGLVDLDVAGGRVVEVRRSAGVPAPGTAADLGGRVVLPGMVDAHVHLDKAHTWDRAPNPRHEFWEAIRVLSADKVNWTTEDLLARGERALASAWEHGTVALRTHLDTDPRQVEISFPAIAELKRRWAGRIRIQSVCLFGVDQVVTPAGERMVRRAAELGCDAIGGMPVMGPDVDRQLDRLFALAAELRLPVDLHVDENLDPGAETLLRTARAALRAGFDLPVTCGHCCSLAVQDPARQAETLAVLEDVGMNIISLPLCNAYLQDRRWSAPVAPGGAVAGAEPARGRTPVHRGLTLLHEMIESGLRVACASDNIRDAFHAYGDLDLWEVLVASIRAGHLDSRMGDAVTVTTSAPAAILGHADLGHFHPGALARFQVFDATTLNLALSRPWAPRTRIGYEAADPGRD